MDWSPAITLESLDDSLVNEITSALNGIGTDGGYWVDHYGAITEAIEQYDISSIKEPTYFVVITDAHQERVYSTEEEKEAARNEAIKKWKLLV